MINFLKETKEAIKESGHNFEDVMFIGSSDGVYRMTLEKFVKLADFEYDQRLWFCSDCYRFDYLF